MTLHGPIARIALPILIALMLSEPAAAQDAESLRMRMGTLAPRGTSWHRALLEMGEQWRAAAGATATFTVFTDGSQGGEVDMVRRMRVGQMNGALLSVVGLSEIDDSVSVLQKMPMAIRTWDELDHVREKLRPTLEKRLLAKGFVVLFWGDGGWVHFFSKEPALRPADYKRMKVFTWAGDNPQVDIMKAMGYQPVVLEISDILPALQTGMINAVPSTPFYALVGQFHRHTPHMLELNWVPIVGAVVITRRAWDGMSPQAQAALKRAADAAGTKLREISRREHAESVEAMKQRGLQVRQVPPEVEAEWHRFAAQASTMVRGRMVPAELYDEVQRILAEYRAASGATQP